MKNKESDKKKTDDDSDKPKFFYGIITTQETPSSVTNCLKSDSACFRIEEKALNINPGDVVFIEEGSAHLLAQFVTMCGGVVMKFKSHNDCFIVFSELSWSILKNYISFISPELIQPRVISFAGRNGHPDQIFTLNNGSTIRFHSVYGKYSQ